MVEIVTRLEVVNGTSSNVTVWLTLSTGGGIEVKELDKLHSGITPAPWGITAEPDNPFQGSFTLPANASVSAWPGYFNGNLAFGALPTSGCPSQQWPQGINIFEFNLNTGGDESIDISCINGVNALLTVSMEGGGVWTVTGSQTATSFQNFPLGQNSNVVGVYPANCPGCTVAGPTPQACPGGSPVPVESPSASSICQLDRTQNGGTVTVTFTGFAST